MPRFFVPSQDIHGKRFVLRGQEARHALVVLRKKMGDEIDCFDGKDLSFRGRILFVSGKESLEGEILSEGGRTGPLPIRLILYQALIKGPKWDWLIEKACEIGVRRVAPLVTARTVVKPAGGTVNGRWKRIALAASKQSGRADVMEILAPQSFPQALADLSQGAFALIPWEKEANTTIRAALSSFPAAAGGGTMDPRLRHSGMTSKVNLFIGPEGGWEDSEIDLARRYGVVAVRLGPTLLRSETAGLVASTLVLRELGVY